MTIQQIKDKYEVLELNLRFVLDENEKPTVWTRHWEDANRTAFITHEDVAKKVSNDPDYPHLKDKPEEKTAESSGEKYLSVIIIDVAPPDFKL